VNIVELVFAVIGVWVLAATVVAALFAVLFRFEARR
jgi:hypothetical protein